MNVQMQSVIWSLAKPLKVHFEKQHLYAHYSKAHYYYDRRCFHLEAGGSLRFDRLLSIFSYKKWVAHTGVNALELRVTYQHGDCRLSLLAYNGDIVRLISTTHLPSAEGVTTIRIPLPLRINLADFLFVQFDAADDTDVFEVAFTTPAPPRQAVRVGLAITTFNRQADVEEQVALLEELEELGPSYHVYVIDNGSNLKLARPYRNTTVIPSVNAGGAGGFTRGLLEVMDNGTFTHAMFMDDDAFCHPEAIARAVAVLRFCTDPKLALTGAMNYLHAQEVQYELGGKLAPYGVQSIRMNEDTNNLRALLDNERAERPDYGAWWCFVFPLNAVEVLPFPFFVRGDDITFSLQNRFTLDSMPGLVAWQPSFEPKIGASVEYLVHRSFLLMPMLAPRKPWSKESVVEGVRRAFASEVDGLRYPIAEAVCRALEDVLTGPAFWMNAANTTARMQELTAMEKAFTARSSLPNWGYLPPNAGMRAPVRLLRRLLGDANLPARLCFRRPALTNDMAPRPGQAFLRPGMIYYASDGSRSMSCARDWRWRRRVERRFAALAAEYESRFDSLREEYGAAREDLQSPAAWKDRFVVKDPEHKDARTAL